MMTDDAYDKKRSSYLQDDSMLCQDGKDPSKHGQSNEAFIKKAWKETSLNLVRN